MIVLLHGADSLAIRRRIRELKDEADGGTGMLTTNLVELDGQAVKPEEILAGAMTPPFLSPSRLVIVDGLLDRFEPTGGRPPRSIDGFEPLFRPLAEEALPPTTMLVFRDAELTDRNPMYKRLRGLPGVSDERHAELKGEPLIRFIREESAAHGIRFRNGPFRTETPFEEEIRRIGDPATLLATITLVQDPPESNQWHSDTGVIAGEIEKLALYAMGREVTVDDVFRVCSGRRHANNFALGDAVLDGNLKTALDALQMLIADGAEAMGLITMLAGRYRQLAQVVDLLDRGATPEEIGASMGRAGQFAGLRNNLIRRARLVGAAGLPAAFAAIVDCDRMIKSGEVRERDGLPVELLVITLARLSGNAGRG
jgi:DNA polymerase III subunit delta